MDEPIFIDANQKIPRSTNTLPNLTKNLAEMAEKYIGQMLPLWKRFNINTGKTDEASKIITQEKCILPAKGSYNDTKGQPGFDRLAIILPETVSAIIVYPPVKGDAFMFQSILDHIHDNQYHAQPDIVVLFAPPFYSTDNIEVNKNILANYLNFKMNEETKAIVYILTQHTDASKMIGCKLYSEQSKPNKPLINMLEPSYVIYPFTRTVADKMVGSILLSASSANEVNLPASNIRQISSVSSYFAQRGRGTLAYPPDITTEDHQINKMLPPYLYRFYGPKAETFDGNVILIDLKGEDISAGMRAMGLDSDMFVGTDEDRLTLDGIDTVAVKILDMPYSVRKPSPEVRKDWLEFKFTMDEAEVLNSLQIKPSVLNSYVFEGDGPGMLVKFLSNMVNSKCYTEKDLLTKEECSISENFIDKVYSYLLEHDPRIDEGIEAKKSEQLRMEAEIKRNEDAEMKEKISKEEAEMAKEDLKKFKALFGLDDSVTDESLAKDPYEDGILVPEDEVDELQFNTVLRDIKKGYYMFIVTAGIVDMFTDVGLTVGRLYVDVKNEQEATPAIDAGIKRLSQAYPGWKFFKETTDKELQKIVGGADDTNPAHGPTPLTVPTPVTVPTPMAPAVKGSPAPAAKGSPAPA